MGQNPIISIQGLSKSYNQIVRVLNNINLEVHEGEIIGYIGPNGAGKSTTVKIILGLVDDYEGEVNIFGQNIKKSSNQYKKRIGYVPENADLYDNLTAREYLTFIGEMYGLDKGVVAKKGLDLMACFGIKDVYDHRMTSYSKGMKQKVLIIASLIHNPDLIFLDEPLNGLDANSVMVVKSLFSKLANQGKTIFYSSHIMDVVEKISNRIILLNKGELIADGSFESLKASSEGTLEEIFNQLTGFHNQDQIADTIVSIIEDGE